MAARRTWIEPVVAGAQVASSFYDTGLLMVVKDHYNQNNTSSNSSDDDALQKAISNFYIIYNLILGLSPILSAYVLAKIGDKWNRKITICVPLGGYLTSRCLLLFVILLDWPIEVMFGSAALNGLTGWFTTYWAGVMAWASLASSERKRSLQLIIIELVYGLAGFAGSLASGHIFTDLNIKNYKGAVLVSCSLACYTFCLLYSVFVLKIPDTDQLCIEHITEEDQTISNSRHKSLNSEYTERSGLLDDQPHHIRVPDSCDAQTTLPASKAIIIIMFISAILYNIASTSTEDVINVFVLKKPLSWGPVDVGYGNAATYVTYITSFLGVYVFSKCLGDLGMIIIGMLSFSAGVLIMAFVRWTFLYYIARAVMMFSLIPTPTIRSMISKNIQGSSYVLLAANIRSSSTCTRMKKEHKLLIPVFGADNPGNNVALEQKR
ncbi:thymic stromal cotransporter homolog isoform X2 [Bombina bombina]|uniref:thymic stromal cotransporter homolog isoform X2 n=1 Tax=Bombina bombina TaxID=8345 RepID=UPI00235AD5AB|nr:thymic stromal cotransporter homolog isoform X2 [Bombina bombina]